MGAPAVALVVDGAPLSERAHALVSTVRVARQLSQPAQCEVSFRADPGLVEAIGPGFPPPLGARLEVSVTGDHDRLFVGDVTGHEWSHEFDGALEVRVRVYDRLHRLRKRQRVVARTDVSVADVAEEVAGEAGLDVDATERGPQWPVLVQHRQSDLQLLQELAEHAGLWFVADDDELRIFTLDASSEQVELTLHDNLLAARFDSSAEPACTTVESLGWDPVGALPLRAEAGSARAPASIANGVDLSALDADGHVVLAGQPGPTVDHLEAAAQAELDRRMLRTVSMTGTTDGDARLVPGRNVRVAGAHPSVAGDYVLTETVHTIDGHGYRTEISTVPPARTSPPTAAEATLGSVTDADDPEGRGRVRVSLPAYADVETDWRDVLALGAGEGKGVVATPDRGDRVLLLLPGGDPAAGVVLGSVFGDVTPSDPGLVGGTVKRWSMLTGSGQRVVLDDDAGRIFLANAAGSTVELAPERVIVHAATDLVIQAPGATMTLRANKIELIQATAPEEAPAHPGAA